MRLNNRLSVQKKQRRAYSGKKKRHTQKAQLLVHGTTGQILATAFESGSRHDFHLYKQHPARILPWTPLLADAGYQGVQDRHPTSTTPNKKRKHQPLTSDQRQHNRTLARQRMIVEHVIRRLKIFRILSERYRNRRKRFGVRFNLIAAIWNMECPMLS